MKLDHLRWAQIFTGLTAVPEEQVAKVLGLSASEARRVQAIAREHLDLRRAAQRAREERQQVRPKKLGGPWLPATAYHPVEGR